MRDHQDGAEGRDGAAAFVGACTLVFVTLMGVSSFLVVANYF